jgi:hemoglobin
MTPVEDSLRSFFRHALSGTLGPWPLGANLAAGDGRPGNTSPFGGAIDALAGVFAVSESNSSLYDRLGGIYAIAAVVDDFIDRVMDDPRLNANPKVDEAHHKVSKAGFKYLVTEMVGWATGGPQKYTGRSMYDSHAHLDITSAEWDAFLDDLRQTFDKFQIPARERAELLAIVNSTKADIVLHGR